jgi:hypothetical protein
VDPCGNGWGKRTLRQTVPHLHFSEFKVRIAFVSQLTKDSKDFFFAFKKANKRFLLNKIRINISLSFSKAFRFTQVNVRLKIRLLLWEL